MTLEQIAAGLEVLALRLSDDGALRGPDGFSPREWDYIKGIAAGEILRMVARARESSGAPVIPDPTDEPLLTDNDRRRLEAIEAVQDPRRAVALIHAYWRDDDRAARTPRGWLFAHLAIVVAAADTWRVAFERRDMEARRLEVLEYAAAGKVLDAIDRAAAGLCGDAAPDPTGQAPYRCTREAGHAGEHVAGIGPWRPGDQALARWAPGRVQ